MVYILNCVFSTKYILNYVFYMIYYFYCRPVMELKTLNMLLLNSLKLP